MEQYTQKTGIYQKLMQIQKTTDTFLQTDASAKKKPGGGNSEYLFTPGWKILEDIRGKMNSLGLMLMSDMAEERHETISYPDYRLVNGTVLTFEKKELLCILAIDFWWLDTDTGETTQKFRYFSSGMNGLDKSLTTAISTAERYFLLKFFHIPTKDGRDEADNHDSRVVIPEGCARVQEDRHQAAGRAVRPVQPTHLQRPTPVPTPMQPAQPVQSDYEAAVRRLMMFDKNTLSHQQVLTEVLASLSLSGHDVSDPQFTSELVEEAQRRRTGGRAQ